MTTRGAGVTFRETMAGWFSREATTAQAGAEAGRRAGTRLELRLTIRIADVAAFVGDPGHLGVLDGVVTSGVLGDAHTCTNGEFRLFAPRPSAPHDAAPGVRMVYGLPVVLEGAPHWLLGYKTVTGRAPWALWPETTTLLTTLHRGGDARGPIVGAGILRLGPLDFLQLLATLRPTPGGGVGAVTRFGAFFAGELMRRYLLPGAR